MLSYCHSLNPPGFIGSISQQQWNCKAIARKMEQWVHLISFHKGSASLRETKLWFRTDNGNQIQWTLIIHFYYVVPINIVSSSKGLMEKSNNGAWMVWSANFFSVTLKIPETNKKLYTHTHIVLLLMQCQNYTTNLVWILERVEAFCWMLDILKPTEM